jgi:hypothetical protein
VVLRWDEQTLAAIPALKTGPTINARALAIGHTAMYDAWAAYDATAVGTRLGGRLRRPAAERTLAHKRMAVSFAAYRAPLNLFPAHWRNVTPFALTSPDQFLPPGPTPDPRPARRGGQRRPSCRAPPSPTCRSVPRACRRAA